MPLTDNSAGPPEWGRSRGCLAATIISIAVFVALLAGAVVLTYRGYQHSLVVGEKAAREQRLARAQAGEVDALKELLERPELREGLFAGKWTAFEFNEAAIKELSRFGAEATPALIGALADNGSPRVYPIAAVTDHLARHDPQLEATAAIVFQRPGEFIGLQLLRYRELAIVKGRRETIQMLADLLVDANPWNALDPYGSRDLRVCDLAAEAIATLAGPEAELPLEELRSSALDATRRDKYVQKVARWCQTPPETWSIAPAGWLRIKVNRLAMTSDGRRKLLVSLNGGPSIKVVRSDNPVSLVFGPLPTGSQTLVLENPKTKKTITRPVTIKSGAASELSADFDEL